ncbi:MAG: DNA polymerase IV [Gammaproteobacteria bacterium]|nr:DNA polymerase IV [Gammaproteobacteria bacterium]
MPDNAPRKIIHVDMDCFYAAIEVRDNPTLTGKPVAVGGSAEERSVLCTCNYPARKFGVRSAMATSHALRLCPDLIVLPVNMKKYREAATIIHDIFREFTPLVEPLSLDEAYLEVTDSKHCQGSATLIAKEIKARIRESVGITASAGVAPNKFLAKIASGWNKPNGLFVICPQDVTHFVKDLKVEALHGVGKVTTEKLHRLNLKTCSDLQKIPLSELTEQFGKRGLQLYQQSRGIDNSPVEPNRIRKSLSVERTFSEDIPIDSDCDIILNHLHQMLMTRIKEHAADRKIKNQYIKIKFNDFKLTTLERTSHAPTIEEYIKLFQEISQHELRAIRLIGIGVHFINEDKSPMRIQQSLL